MTAQQQIGVWVSRRDTSYLVRLCALLADGLTPASAVRIIRLSDDIAAQREKKSKGGCSE